MSTFSRPYLKNGQNPTYIVGNIDKNLNMKIGACPSCTTSGCTQKLNNAKCKILQQRGGPSEASTYCNSMANDSNKCNEAGCLYDGKTNECVLPNCGETNLSPTGCCINQTTKSVGSNNSWNVGQPLPKSGICSPVNIDLSGAVRAAGWYPTNSENSSSECVSLGQWSSLPAILFYISLLLLCLFIYFWARKTF